MPLYLYGLVERVRTGVPMCLSVPARIVGLEHEDQSATVEVLGATRNASVMLVPEVQVGDWVLVHVGFAIARIDEQEAASSLALLDAALSADLADGDPGPDL